tara:strand:+ start:754 stop:903 length:150 start_codon:yes stop_codon:yes gene_type:complete
MDELSAVNGGGPVAIASWVDLNLYSGGIPAFVDLAHGSAYMKEVIESKY